MTRTAFVTGSAGFIGFHLSRALLAAGWRVIGLDGMTSYYDVTLKQRRHQILSAEPGFTAHEGLVETPGLVRGLIDEHRPDSIVHLAAQAGVRYSIDAPRSYVEANLIGTFEILEAARAHAPAHLLIASTSSAFGANTSMPYREVDRADHQMSFYAATKKATESMAHSYAHLYNIPTTMFRFFTVYGPWGRPDMALFKFTSAILEDRPIDIYNHGDMMRDFTYVDDLVAGISRLIDAAPANPASDTDKTPPQPAAAIAGDSLSPVAPWRVVNIGNGTPVRLMDFVTAIEEATGRTARKNFLPMQPGDVPATWADTTLSEGLIGSLPQTDIRRGVALFDEWYRDYYGA